MSGHKPCSSDQSREAHCSTFAHKWKARRRAAPSLWQIRFPANYIEDEEQHNRTLSVRHFESPLTDSNASRTVPSISSLASSLLLTDFCLGCFMPTKGLHRRAQGILRVKALGCGIEAGASNLRNSCFWTYSLLSDAEGPNSSERRLVPSPP